MPELTGVDNQIQTYAVAGDAAKVKELLDLGADPTARNEAGNTALQLAMRSRNLETLRLLVDAGAELDEADGVTRRRVNSTVSCQWWTTER